MGNERRVEYTTIKLELDERTSYYDYKKNRYSGYIKSIRVGRSSSPNAVFKVRLKEGDEIQLWPGRIINFSQRSEGAVFSWDSLPNEWAEIEVSEDTFFVASESSDFSNGVIGETAKSFKKSKFTVNAVTATKILSNNDLRTKAIIHNTGIRPLFISCIEEDLNPADGTRAEKCIKIWRFEKKELEISGELFAMYDTSMTYTSIVPAIHDVFVEEFLK